MEIISQRAHIQMMSMNATAPLMGLYILSGQQYVGRTFPYVTAL